MTAEIITLRERLMFKATKDVRLSEASVNLRDRVDRVREAFNSKPKVEVLHQRITLAQNLWKILEELEAKGTRKRDVLEKAALGSRDSSTKSLYNYALDPQTVNLETPSLDRRLIKKASKYLNILQAAADLSKESADSLLLRFVAGSEYDVSLNEDARFSENSAYRDIANFLNELASRIAMKFPLTEYYRYIGNHNVLYNDTLDEFEQLPPSFVVHLNPLAEALSDSIWTSSLSVLRYGPFLHLYDYNVLEFTDAKLLCRSAEDESLLSEEESPLHVYKRVFLGHLPTGISGKAEFCFVEEFHSDFNSGSNPERTNSLYGVPGVKNLQRLRPALDAKEVVYDTIFLDTRRATQAGLPEPGGGWTRIYPVTTASCRQFLSTSLLKESGRVDYGAYAEFSFQGDALGSSRGRSSSPSATIAETLDLDLYRDDHSLRFDSLYARRVQRMVAALDRYRTSIDLELSKVRLEVLKAHGSY